MTKKEASSARTEMRLHRRRILIGSATVASVILLAVLCWVASVSFSHSSLEVRSEEGGFEVTLGSGWTENETSGPDEWFTAGRQLPIGRSWAWIWLDRVETGEGDAVDLGSVEQSARNAITERWGDRRIDAMVTTFQGLDAVRLSYERPLDGWLDWLSATDAQEVRYVVIAGRYTYIIAIGGWRNLPNEASDLESHVRLLNSG